MSRLFQLGLLTCVAGLGMPIAADACWFCGGRAPYSAGYSAYYAGYYGGPYSYGYSPGIGCSSCQSCASYAPACGCSPCVGACGVGCGVGCSSGTCGTGCSTTVNSPGALAPVPDGNSSTRSIESRLETLEKALNITPPRSNGRTYEPDRFNSVSNRGTRGTGTETPPRTQGTDSADPNDFPPPRRTGPDDAEMFRQNESSQSGTTTETFRPSTDGVPLGVPGTPGDTVIPSKKPAPGSTIDDKGTPDDKGAPAEKGSQALRLDTRVTSRAVSPRERHVLSTQPVAVAKKRAPARLQVDAQPQTVNVARY